MTIPVVSGGVTIGNPSGGMAVASVIVTAADVTASFGALTPAGEGGVAVTGTSISSGDASGHWQISGGYLSPSATGASANLNLGPYSLVLDDAQTVDITIVSNAMHARTWATASAHVTLANQGRTIYLRENGSPYTTGSMASLGSGLGLSSYVIIRSENSDNSAVTIRNDASYGTITMTSMTWIKWHGVSFEHREPTQAFSQAKAYCTTLQSATDVWLYQCRVFSDMDTWRSGYRPNREWVGIRGENTDRLKVEECEIDHCVHGIEARNSDDLTILNNEFHHLWSDSLQYLGSSANTLANLTLQGNHCHDLIGDYLFLHPDMLLQTYTTDANASNVTGMVIRGNVVYPGYEGVRSGPDMVTTAGGSMTLTSGVLGGTPVSSNLTLDATYQDKCIDVLASGGAVTITLPAASAIASNNGCGIRRLPTSDSDVIVQRAGADTLLGGASVTLDSGDPYLVAQSNGTSAWTAGTVKIAVQGAFFVQMDGGNFTDPIVEANIIFTNGAHAITAGDGTGQINGTSAIIQHNSVFMVYPGDTTGNGTPNELQDGATSADPWIRHNSANTNTTIARNAYRTLTEDSSAATKTNNYAYTATTLAALQAVWDFAGTTCHPTTYAEAIAIARPITSGSLDLGAGVYIGALGPTDGTGFWNPTSKSLN